jgi:CRISPR-associated protein Csd2
MFNDAINNRYEFVMLYDVTNGNPNGDPDSGNMPRIDPETGHGIVTDVCIKRKIRNYVDVVRGEDAGFGIYIKQDIPLAATQNKGIAAVDGVKDKAEKSLAYRDYMCSHYYDIRTFGAVMAAAVGNKELQNTAGQVRGPVQLAFGHSIDPVVPQEITITRVAIETEKKAETASTEMGRKHIIPYGLYRQEGFISANLAQRVTGFSEQDLDLLWEAINNMFEFDRSAARGIMALRGLYVFKHDSPLGCAPAHKLFSLIDVSRKPDVAVPRRFEDYTVTVGQPPEGVTVKNIAL